MIPILFALFIMGLGGGIVGYVTGARRCDRKWLMAMLDDTADYDTMLIEILASIQDEKSA